MMMMMMTIQEAEEFRWQKKGTLLVTHYYPLLSPFRQWLLEKIRGSHPSSTRFITIDNADYHDHDKFSSSHQPQAAREK
ncbi:unnamed protein product [Prunus armeniaca]|uniref:Uncharacterized protein n=1 Tax=Prunus armeniaca TaxID=36596 RepID=A0A6J5VQ70_PRUAR|nr:unnamed protein product [Prunus armeniaca]